MARTVFASAAVVLMLSVTSAFAASGAPATDAWSEIRTQLYGNRPIEESVGAVRLETPYRAENDLRVPVRAIVDLPGGETIKRLTLVLDENPMPVSADFALELPTTAFAVEATMRFDGPTGVHAVVETESGRLYAAEAMVKTSGVGACAAPPTTGVEEALATLGQMDLTTPSLLEQAAGAPREVALDIRHPQHSGMQMDQVTLHYILARYVETIEGWADEDKLFTMTGSISLAEDPQLRFSLPAKDVSKVRMRLTDTDGAVFQKVFAVGGS